MSVTHETTEKEGVHVCNCGKEFDFLWRARKHIEVLEKDYSIDISPPGGNESTYERHHKGQKWELNRIVAKIRDNFECVDCGMTQEEHIEKRQPFGDGLHVHHKVPVREFADPTEAHELWNLVTVCLWCHAEREGNYTSSV